ncbi:MAG: ABC transporter substrate-binding protein [Acidimicrobiia bacterium]
MSCRRGRVATAGLVSALVLAATACGTENAGLGAPTTSPASNTVAGASAASGTPTVASSVKAPPTTASGPLGAPNKASGDAIAIGYIGDGQSATIDSSADLLAAKASVAYANDYLGGVAGRPIKLMTCETHQDAAQATACSNQLASSGVLAVLVNVSGQMSAIAKPLQEAKVPLFVWQGADIASDPNSTFVFSNGIASIVHPATVARAEGFTRAAILVIDVPAAAGAAKALGVPLLAKAGATAEVTAIAAGAKDMMTPVQQALTKNPQIVHLIGDAEFCTGALEALAAAGYTGTITAISQCIDDKTISFLGSYLKGLRVSYTATVDPTDPDYKRFVEVIDKYADGNKISLTSTPVGAYGVVATFSRAMAGATGDITRSSMIDTVRSLGPLPLTMGSGLTFKCGANAVAILPAICTSGFLEATLDASGQPTHFTAVEPGDLMTLG